MDKIALFLHNGMGSRLLPLISCVRFAREAKKQVVCYWSENPGKQSFPYEGDISFTELFEPLESVEFVRYDTFIDNYPGSVTYDLKYRKGDKVVIDLHTSDTIFIMRAVEPLFSTDEYYYNFFNINYNRLSDESLNDYIRSYRFFLKELKPVPSIQKRIKKVYEKFENKNMIGLHIRRSDGVFLGSEWSEADNALIEMGKKWISQGYTIFLATDDPKYETVFGEEGVIINNSEYKYRNNTDNTIHAVVDMYLLSYCPYIIGTEGSAFSLFSYLLSNNSLFWTVGPNMKTIKDILV